MQAVTELLKMGVDYSYVMQTMHNDTLRSLQKRSELLKRAERLLDGNVSCVCINRAESEVTMYAEEENRWRCSFRSDGKWINVNELLQAFGEGGYAAAGVCKRTNDVEKFRQEILERIVVMRKLSN